MQVTIGGERLGAGNKNKVWMREYERSTHDIGYVWRSTMASGTLVPFLCEVALPGDTLDIDLNAEVLTHPTIGPLFGTYKLQLDVFQIPVRLYQAQLHMNLLGVGMDMSKVKLPELLLEATQPDPTKSVDNQQINPSCIFSYLGIRGLGYNKTASVGTGFKRKFNAVPYLGYWDIYKNYYANKQEEIGAVIHKDLTANTTVLTGADTKSSAPPINIPAGNATEPATFLATVLNNISSIVISGTGITSFTDDFYIILWIKDESGVAYPISASLIFTVWEIHPDTQTIIGHAVAPVWLNRLIEFGSIWYNGTNAVEDTDTEPQIRTFPLANIDDMRKEILAQVNLTTPFQIDINRKEPYNLPFAVQAGGPGVLYAKAYNQEGLALKTYQSDLFNNWISTEWIDGADGISEVTKVDTSSGGFTIDELNLSKKIYDMLNRIALSGGSYDDWLDAVYTHDRTKSAENPIYLGGLIKQIVFQEVVSTAVQPEQPLGTLAGRGKMGHKHKGGHIIAKTDEPSYIMGIVSITPNIDYSQGNKWDTNLKTMNDFHKPALDEIGFQDLITDQMGWFDTEILDTDGTLDPVFKSAGKQPAWINYMTNINVVRGNFADQAQQMFMVLNRRYQPNYATGGASGVFTIKDVTTYIDPVKFNHIFADTRRDAQNFWVQIGLNIEARRKMSAKVIPNL
ncbi:MAG: major capsid protein [Microviridae sp.]|nr:MAG: major capsid protein [Microviridae sp.]